MSDVTGGNSEDYRQRKSNLWSQCWCWGRSPRDPSQRWLSLGRSCRDSYLAAKSQTHHHPQSLSLGSLCKGQLNMSNITFIRHQISLWHITNLVKVLVFPFLCKSWFTKYEKCSSTQVHKTLYVRTSMNAGTRFQTRIVYSCFQTKSILFILFFKWPLDHIKKLC